MKKLKFLAFALAASALALTITSCNGDDPVAPPPPPPPQTWEDAPNIENPGPGYFTLAIAVATQTEEHCNGIFAAGSFNGWDNLFTNSAGMAEYMFTRVEGTETWYKITVPWTEDLELKPVALNNDGEGSWNFQWGRNDTVNDEIRVFFEPNRPEVGTLSTGFGSVGVGGWEMDFAAYEADNSVAFIVVKAWRDGAPCVPPAVYTVTFNMTGPALPAGAEVGIVGNFPSRSWQINDPFVMTYSAGTWSVTIEDVPTGMAYKYFWRFADGTLGWYWNRDEANEEGGGGDDRVFRGGTTVNDEVVGWRGVPDFDNPMDPQEEWTVQLHGNAVPNEDGEGGGSWRNAFFTFASSTIADAANLAGTYVFTIEDLELIGGYDFGMRIMTENAEGNLTQFLWVNAANPDFEITGDTGNFSGTGNIRVENTRTYPLVTVTIEWSGLAVTSFVVNFPTPSP